METGGGINIPRRQLISDEKLDSPNLRDYLRIRQDENLNINNNNNNINSNSNSNSNSVRANMSGLTLSAVLKTEDRSGGPMRTQSNRTLMDIIREDPNGGGNSSESRKRWRNFKEKLRLRRQGSGSSWTSSVPVPTSDVPIQPSRSSSSSTRMMMLSRRDSTRLNMSTPEQSSQPDVDLSSGVPRSRSAMLQRNESRAIRRAGGRYNNIRGIDDEMGGEDEEETTEGETTAEEEEAGEGGGGAGGEEQPVRMSLMALLAETDGQMGLDGLSYMTDDEDDEEEEEEEEEEGGAGGGGYNNCCVCMVRHKGAAFIPCGHTFCRLCSRELWVQRGNCPLCNNFILEILDIF